MNRNGWCEQEVGATAMRLESVRIEHGVCIGGVEMRHRLGGVLEACI